MDIPKEIYVIDNGGYQLHKDGKKRGCRWAIDEMKRFETQKEAINFVKKNKIEKAMKVEYLKGWWWVYRNKWEYFL